MPLVNAFYLDGLGDHCHFWWRTFRGCPNTGKRRYIWNQGKW